VPERSVPKLAAGTLAALAALKLAVHLVAIGRYGYFRDELYYLASTEHLAWGYVDHPPLSIALLALGRAGLGDSLPAVRLLVVLAGVATVFLTGVIARMLGGGRFAQGLAALCVLMAPVCLGQARYYSMNGIELLLWTAAVWQLLRAVARARWRDWVLLGTLLGLGLLNKISTLWLGGGILVGLLLSPHRRMLRRPGPWIAAGVASAIFLPHLAWQVRHGWPTVEFLRNAAAGKMAATSPFGFLLDQLRFQNPGAAVVWVTGIGFGLVGREARGRLLAWTYLAILAVLLVFGRSRASYLAPAYPMLFALGAVALERFASRPRLAWSRPVLVSLVVAVGLVLVPLALPVLPVATFVRYQAALGLAPHTEERHEMGALPQHYADMFGWEEMSALVAEAYRRLDPQEQTRCRVFGQNYGEAGAIDVLGRRLGLPAALSGHNSYWLWGPGDGSWDVLIIIGGDREDNAEFFEDIDIVGQTRSPWSMPYERGLDVSIARRPRLSARQAWPLLKSYN
jgi:hypothetical protein